MVLYGLDRDKTLAHRGLISRYGALSAMSSRQSQRRGREFNALVADVLRYWGVDDVESGVRGLNGSDEIDVVFSLGGTPYLLEAKWYTGRAISDDPTAKLQRRIRRRPRGTRGIVLSISGFTKTAIESADRGEQPEVLLLDRSHFEAMLAGLLPPQDLLATLMRHVTRHGGVHVPLTTLLGIHASPVPKLVPGFVPVPPAELPWETVLETAGGIDAHAILLGDSGWPEPDGLGTGHHSDLLITSPAGIVRTSTEDGVTDWALPLEGCRGAPMETGNGLLTICNHAAVRWDGGELKVLGGGFTGNSTLMAGRDGQPWVYDNTGSDSTLLTLTELGGELGSQVSHEIDFPANVWGAAWLERGRFFLAADGHSAVVDVDVDAGRVSRDAWMQSPQEGPRPIVVRDKATVITAARTQPGVRGSIYQMSLTTGCFGRLADLEVNRIQGLATLPDGSAYLLADVRGNCRTSKPVIIRVDGLVSPQSMTT